MKLSAAYSIKNKIIVMVMDYNDNPTVELKLKIRKEIKNLAEFYRVPLNRRKATVLKPIFREFILNQSGYIYILPRFYACFL